jgi:hypothetical protein
MFSCRKSRQVRDFLLENFHNFAKRETIEKQTRNGKPFLKEETNRRHKQKTTHEKQK